MCLINFQFHEHPSYRLIVAANRDEFYQRPTEPAHFWQDEPNILAGRDLKQMGTWLGITKAGKFAALTNYRAPDHMGASKKSRGEIVRNYLSGDSTPQDFLVSLKSQKEDYVGFNVLLGNEKELFYYNNIENKIQHIEKGHTYGLSNHFLNTPWPKVIKGRTGLRNYMKENDEVRTKDLFELLLDAEEAKEDTLPDTGVGTKLEKKLSPLFIDIPEYGTRCSTVLTIDHQNRVSFTERTYHKRNCIDERHFDFEINNN